MIPHLKKMGIDTMWFIVMRQLRQIMMFETLLTVTTMQHGCDPTKKKARPGTGAIFGRKTGRLIWTVAAVVAVVVVVVVVVDVRSKRNIISMGRSCSFGTLRLHGLVVTTTEQGDKKPKKSSTGKDTNAE